MNNLKKEIVRYSFILIILIIIGAFIYPTMYRYDKYDQKIPVRINRITGKAEFLRPEGWLSAAPTPTPSPSISVATKVNITPSPTPKTLNGETYQQYRERVLKELKPGQPAPEDFHLFLNWESAARGIGKLVEPKDYFTVGATQEEVRKAMGVPTSISDDPYSVVWYYKGSRVTFVNGKVKEYYNDGGSLNVY